MKGLRLAGTAAVSLLFSGIVVVQAAPATHAVIPFTAQPKAAAVVPNGSWPVYHHDNAHTGYDGTQPTSSTATTGWVSGTMDAPVYGSPLVYGGIVYSATLNNTVYAFNQADGSTLWSRNLGAPTTTGWNCGNVSFQGILGTPVIDTAAGRIYVAALGSDHVYRVFGLGLASGATQLTTAIPTTIGDGTFDWTIQQQRGALGLANGFVYVPFGGRWGDCGSYHGWVVGVPTNGGTTPAVYETPSTGSGIWAAGGVVTDDATGNVFFATGNAMPRSSCPTAVNSDSVIRTGPALGTATSFFQPQDWLANWCDTDTDLGSASPTLISPSLAFMSGKYGQGFLLDPTNLGGTNGQIFPARSPYAGADVCVGNHNDATFGSFAYAAPYIYLSCQSQGIVGLKVDTTAKTFSLCDATCAAPSWNSGAGKVYGPPIVAGGIVWAVDTNGSGLTGFDAATGTSVFQSGTFPAHNFSTPSEAGGQVFVGSDTVIRSFNLVVNVCPSVTASAAPASPQTSGTPVTVTAVASGCPNPRYEFWILPPAGSWTIAQPYSSTATYNWNTTGLAAGTYSYSVWVRDASSAASYDSFFPGTAYTLTTTACNSVTASAAPASPQTVGTPVTITASASGCTARYEFWILPPGGSWAIAQPYSGTATFNWTTTGLPAGTYNYSVWARDNASAAAYDTYFPGTAYVLTSAACSSVTASAAPASPQSAGTPVTITATASGCPNARYEFWILPPGGSWTIMQAYSASATFNWNTTPTAGVYRYSVWVRDNSSAAAYDTYFPGTTYTLTTTPCTSVTASAAPASPQAHGTTVTITASASGCTNPRYEFWILAPGGSWAIAQAYSSTATFSWNTTGLAAGVYRYSVWARDASSGAGYDTYFPGTAYTLT